MLVQSLRAARPMLVRVARTQVQRTLFTPTAMRSADLVQDIYLRELKTYKPTPVKATDAEGHVQKFAVPSAPKSPEEADLASELKSYETQTVEIEGAASSEGAEATEELDWFEPEEEATPAAAH